MYTLLDTVAITLPSTYSLPLMTWAQPLCSNGSDTPCTCSAMGPLEPTKVSSMDTRFRHLLHHLVPIA